LNFSTQTDGTRLCNIKELGINHSHILTKSDEQLGYMQILVLENKPLNFGVT